MRRPVKFRIAFYLVAIVSFYLGSQFLPESLPDVGWSLSAMWAQPDWQNTLLVSLLFFVVIPTLHYFWIIKIGEQALWKILIVLSLSSLVARYNYPQQLAQYFEFISWLKYPFIAVLLALELYLMVTIIKAIWGARKLSGDPRLHMIDKFEVAGDEKKDSKEAKQLELALMFAHEPASWYYAIPRFSRKHIPAIAHIQLLSANWLHYILVLTALVGVTAGSYLALAGWSETVAIVVATLIFYGLIMFVANFRVSRHFSLYPWQDKLVVNNSWWGVSLLNLTDISAVEKGEWSSEEVGEDFHFGRGHANIKIEFVAPQRYYSAMASFKEDVETLYLTLDDPDALIQHIGEHKPLAHNKQKVA